MKKVNLNGREVEVWFNEYNYTTKKKTQIELPITKEFLLLIKDKMEDTDFGEFFFLKTGDKEITGYFSF